MSYLKAKRESEGERYLRMNQMENQLRAQGLSAIAGLDEAGRGPLAGPVTLAACILDPDQVILGLNDSKKLSEKKRECLFEQILEKAIAYAIVFKSAREIDERGINVVLQEAMEEALAQLGQSLDFVLFDQGAWRYDGPHEKIVKGDAQCNCIAAASILAKVSRDRYLTMMDQTYPDYGFAKHKGYGTRQHMDQILKLGLTPEHRKSFLGKLLGIPAHGD